MEPCGRENQKMDLKLKRSGVLMVVVNKYSQWSPELQLCSFVSINVP